MHLGFGLPQTLKNTDALGFYPVGQAGLGNDAANIMKVAVRLLTVLIMPVLMWMGARGIRVMLRIMRMFMVMIRFIILMIVIVVVVVVMLVMMIMLMQL